MKEFTKRIISILILVSPLLLFTNKIIYAQQEQVRLMAYNLLDYWNTSTNGDSTFRNTYFRTVFGSISPSPDLIAACEINDNTSAKADSFLTKILNYSNPSLYTMSPFIPDTDYVTHTTVHTDANVLYYKPSKFTLLSAKIIIRDKQDANSGTNHPSYEYQLYNNLTGDKIFIYGVHLTSMNSSTGRTLRNLNADTIRTYTDALPSGSYFIIAGDFNFYSGGNEPALVTFTDSTNTGFFRDPLSLPLNDPWSTSPYYQYHTLSTRTSSFGGSTENYGLMFRSDIILNSKSIMNSGGVTYVSSSYTTYDNDGQHYQKSITASPVIPAGSTVATALYNASDHLPVYADYTFAIPSTINPSYPGSIVFTQVGVDDGSGNNVIEFMTLYRMNLTTLKITNNPIQANGTLGSSGGTFDLSNTTWTDVPAGTFIRLGSNLTNDNNASDRILQYDGAGSGTLPSLTSGSNQLIAYTGSASAPTYFIAGIHWGDVTGWTSSSNAPGTPSDIQLTSAASYDWHYSSTVSGNLYDTRNSLTSVGNWTGTGALNYQDLRGSIGSGALPVELSSFIASVSGNNIELRWRTETEVNNFGFEVERSTDKNSWNKIGFKKGYGNSNSPKEYLFEDKNPAGGTNYYRLKQIDNDGAYEYSKIIEIKNYVPSILSLEQNYPNPFNPTTVINYSIPKNGPVTLKVYDILGREIQTLVNKNQAAGKYSVQFNASNLASGIYFYVLNSGNTVLSRKMNFIK